MKFRNNMHSWVYGKRPNCTRLSDWWNLGVFEKLTCACFSQIALKTILLPILIALCSASLIGLCMLMIWKTKWELVLWTQVTGKFNCQRSMLVGKGHTKSTAALPTLCHQWVLSQNVEAKIEKKLRETGRSKDSYKIPHFVMYIRK